MLKTHSIHNTPPRVSGRCCTRAWTRGCGCCAPSCRTCARSCSSGCRAGHSRSRPPSPSHPSPPLQSAGLGDTWRWDSKNSKISFSPRPPKIGTLILKIKQQFLIRDESLDLEKCPNFGGETCLNAWLLAKIIKRSFQHR